MKTEEHRFQSRLVVAWLRTVLEISVFQNLITLSWLKSFIQRTIGWEGMKKIGISTLDMRYLTSDLLYDQHLLAACQIILASLLMEKGNSKGNFQFPVYPVQFLRYESSTLLLYKELRSIIFQSLSRLLSKIFRQFFHFVKYKYNRICKVFLKAPYYLNKK